MARQMVARMEAIGDIIEKKPQQGYWLGSPLPKLGQIVNQLPIAVSGNSRYLFSLNEGELEIAGLDTGLNQYRITDTDMIETIEVTDRGTRIKLARAIVLDGDFQRVTSLSLVNEVASLSSRAVSLATLIAPIELLDEYAEITNRLGKSAGSTTDIVRRDELVMLIGKEYIKRSKQQVPSRRSTPEPSGESRCTSYGMGG